MNRKLVEGASATSESTWYIEGIHLQYSVGGDSRFEDDPRQSSKMVQLFSRLRTSNYSRSGTGNGTAG